MISYPWMNKKKNWLIVSGIILSTGFIAALWVVWQPLWKLKTSGLPYIVNRTISHRLPNLKNGIRKAFLLPSEENYQKIYQTINKNIFNKIDKQKDQSDNIAAQRAANIIFSVSGKDVYYKLSDNINLLDDETNKLIWKFISDQNQVKPAYLISQEFSSHKNNVLKMNLNPLSYIDYSLHQRYATLAVTENLQKLENNIKQSKISTTIITHPKQQNFDLKIVRLEIDNLSLTSLILDEIHFQLNTSTDTTADLFIESDKRIILPDKYISSSAFDKTNGSLKFSGVNLQISGKDSSTGSKLTLFMISNQPLQFKSMESKLTNSLTKKQIKESEFRLINDETFRYLPNISQSPAEFVKQHPQFLLQNKGSEKNSIALLPPGKYSFPETVVIPATLKEVRMLPGTTIKFFPGASLISYSPVIAEGTVNSPIKFTASSSIPWGTVAIVNTKDKKSFFSHVLVEEAGPTTVNGIIFSGGLATHYADSEILDSVFTHNHGDDGVNIKYSTADIRRNQFIDNDFDGLDLDSVSGTIKNNVFSGNGGDGLDISWNTSGISDNFMSNNKDKCLSIGEKSAGLVSGNTFENCDIGIAVKDLSNISLVNNIIRHNRQGLAVYQKKSIFGGGIANLDNNVFSNNQTDVWADEQSTVTGENK